MNLATSGLTRPRPVDSALKDELGERYTEDPFERSFYRRDLAAIPPLISRFLAETNPDAVARPQSTDEVARLVSYAASRQIPITPRAAATTTYWNSVPVRGGLVIDLTGLKGLVNLDQANKTVTVWAGTRWNNLEATLSRQGYALCTYPSSAPASTVAGWVNMEGLGIGTLKYGDLNRLVVALEMVLPNGQVTRITRTTQPPLDWFVGSEGTLGIVTQVELAIRTKPESVRHFLLAFDSIQSLQQAAIEFASSAPVPYNLHFSDVGLYRLLAQAGFHQIFDRPTLLISYDGTKDEVHAGADVCERIMKQANAVSLSGKASDEEWNDRFNMLKIKRAGPSVLGAEVMLPIQKLSDYAGDVLELSQRQKLSIACYGHVVSPSHVTVMSLFPCDESRAIPYLLDLSLTQQLFRRAFRHSGRPYGIGYWNAPYWQYRWTKRERQARRARKKELDPANIMNPGKSYSPPWILSPALFDLTMSILSGVRRVC